MVSSFSFCSSPSSVSLSLTSPFSSSSWCGDLGIQQPRSPTAHSTPLGPGCHVSVLTASGTFHSTCFWHPSRYAVAYIRNLFFHCLLQLPSSSVSTFGWYRNAETCSRSWQLCVLAVCRNGSNKMASAPKISDGAPNHWTLFYSHNSSCKWVWEFSFFVCFTFQPVKYRKAPCKKVEGASCISWLWWVKMLSPNITATTYLAHNSTVCWFEAELS